MAEVPAIDFIVRGEGEEVVVQFGIIAMAAWVAGFARETDRDYWRLLRQIIAYDPDQIQALYATPHRWTDFARQESDCRVIQTDLGRWDYKHQVLASAHVPPWRVLLWMKLIEAVSQLRPKSLGRLLAHPDSGFRAAMRWYYRIGRRVWAYELWQWLFHDRRTANGPNVAGFLGLPLERRPTTRRPTSLAMSTSWTRTPTPSVK